MKMYFKNLLQYFYTGEGVDSFVNLVLFAACILPERNRYLSY